MKHIFIINPTAGKTDSRQKIYDMAESLRQKHGLDVQCILTKKQGHATELAKKLCETGEALRFYACGGDGTVNEVANGIIGYDNAAKTAKLAPKENISLKEACVALGFLTAEKFDEVFHPEQMV